MMGYRADWTRVAEGYKRRLNTATTTTTSTSTSTSKSRRSGRGEGEGEGSDIDSEDADKPVPARTRRSAARGAIRDNTNTIYNGMHMYMRENPGKDVRQVALLWRELDKETKMQYTAKARLLSNV
jgi:hypothetical protein